MVSTGGGGHAMVGRRAELATVRGLVDRARRGAGGLLLVTGEAGIGKSRLLTEAIQRARDTGLLVLAGRAVDGGGTYRAVAEALVGAVGAERPVESGELRPYRAALGRILPGWAGVSPAADPGVHPAAEPSVDPALVLGEGLLRLLRTLGGEQGCLLVLEDVHWADPDTLALLEYLAGAARGWPVLVAASARDDEPVSGAIGRLAGRAEVTTVPLRRLDPAEIAALAEHRAGGVPVPAAALRFLVEKSDGLPFLVEELVAGILETGLLPDPERGSPPMPPTLAGLVAARLSTLIAAQRRVLEAAAVLGTDPDWTVLGPVTGLAEPVVLGALRAAHPHLLVAAGDHSGWRHALTRDAVLATVLPAERAALARRAAGVLLRRGEAEDEAHAADLLAGASDQARAAEILLRLARQDAAAGAFRSAENLLARAAATNRLAAEVAIERVRLLTLLGRAPSALEAGAAAIGGTAGDQHAELCLELAGAAIVAGQWSEADRYVERAGRPDDPSALCLAADAAFGAGDPRRAAGLAAAGIERAERAGRWEALCQALAASARCAMREDPPAALTAFRRAAQIAAEHRLPSWRVRALIGLSTVELFEQATSPALREARALALDTGQLAQVVSADVLLVDCVSTIDGPRAAEELARGAAEQAALLRLSSLQALAELFMALGRAADGDGEAMEALLVAATARPHITVEVAALAPAVRAMRQLMAHDLRAASVLLNTGMAILAEHGSYAPVQLWGLWALLRTVVADRDAEARDALRHSPAVLRALNRGGLQYADAVAAGRAGRPEEASALLAAAEATLAGQHWWGRLLRLLALEAAIADGWGDPVPALRTDLQVFEHTGEPQLARTCRDLLRRAGAPTRRGRGLAPVPAELRAAGVTSREMDVLGLLAQGLTNRQIAERLFLSRRTVDTHVASLLAKTGAASRAELRSMAAVTR
jgi:DNA-binding NarL/FixJ family response regulator